MAKMVLIASLALYVISFFLTAFTTNDNAGIKSTAGYEAFLVGTMAVLGGGLLEWIVWLANPFFLYSIILSTEGKQFKALASSLLAVFLALSFLTWKEVLANEGGATAPIRSRDLGYFLWLISMAIWAIYLIFHNIKAWLTSFGKSFS